MRRLSPACRALLAPMASAVLSAACSSQERIGLPTLLMLPQTLPCAITPSEPLLPPIVADATGGDPAWVVTGAGALQWTAAGMKTLWIFKTRNRVHVIGHEVNTGATLRFQRHGLDGPIENDMTIDNPRRESVLPGGASRDLLDTYSFITSYVFYPDPGCYQFDIDIERSTRHIIVQVK
jgi:hypothetical protein